jgi:hypothetical protein
MKLLKVTITTLIVFIGSFSSQSYAQDVEFKRSGNWEFLYEMDGVNFYYNVVECHDEANGYHREYVHFKLENTNDYDVAVEWDIIMYYNGKCLNCGDKQTIEHHRVATVSANTSTEGQCMDFGNKTLRVFSRLLNYNDPTSTLTKFELINKTINKLK